MAEDPRVNKYERQLQALPKEFIDVSTWGWLELRPQLLRYALAHGMNRTDATRTAARLSRVLCKELYGDILRGRHAPKVSHT